MLYIIVLYDYFIKTHMQFLDKTGLKKVLELILNKFKVVERKITDLENRPTGPTNIVDGSWNIPEL